MRAFIVVVSLFVALSAPALAAPEPELPPIPFVAQEPPKHLGTARGLATIPPLLLAGAGLVFPPALAAAPFGFGLGHFYAGDPVRGSLVTLGGPVIIGGTGFAALYIEALSRPPAPPDTLYSPLTGVMMAGLAAMLYGLWAVNDAEETARRFNERHTIETTRPEI